MRLGAGGKASEAAPSLDCVPSVMVRPAEGLGQQRGVCVCSTAETLVLELG